RARRRGRAAARLPGGGRGGVAGGRGAAPAVPEQAERLVQALRIAGGGAQEGRRRARLHPAAVALPCDDPAPLGNEPERLRGGPARPPPAPPAGGGEGEGGGARGGAQVGVDLDQTGPP